MFKSTFGSNRLWGIAFLCLAGIIGFAHIWIPSAFSHVIPDILTTITLILGALSAIIFSRALLNVARFTYNRWKSNKQVNQHIHLDFDTPIPEHLLEMAHDIEVLGFEKLGVKALIQKNGQQDRYWLWLDETRNVSAYLFQLSSQRAFVAFNTDYSDGFSVETTYKWGMNVDGEDVMVNNFNSSIAEAYDFHMYLYHDQVATHGQPKTFETLSDTDPTSEEIKRHAKDIYASHMRGLTPFILLYGALTLAFLLFGYLSPTMPTLALFSFFLIMGLQFTFVNTDTVDEVFKPLNKRKPRKAVEQ